MTISSDFFGYSEKILNSAREIFAWLCQDVADLRTKWDLYLALFANEDSTQLLSDLAPASFHMFEDALRRDVMMAICRLSDPVRSSGQNNLSFRTLARILGDDHVSDDDLQDFLDACKPVRMIRHKRLAHNALESRLRPLENPLPGITRGQIERIITLAEQVLNSIYRQFEDGEFIFQKIQRGGADTLLYWLRNGKEYAIQKKKARLKGSA